MKSTLLPILLILCVYSAIGATSEQVPVEYHLPLGIAMGVLAGIYTIILAKDSK